MTCSAADKLSYCTQLNFSQNIKGQHAVSEGFSNKQSIYNDHANNLQSPFPCRTRHREGNLLFVVLWTCGEGKTNVMLLFLNFKWLAYIMLEVMVCKAANNN